MLKTTFTFMLHQYTFSKKKKKHHKNSFMKQTDLA